MTAHLHATYVEGCFRCDLSRDEVRAPLACPAHPSTDLVHLDGPCRCFYGGPGPQHAASRPPGAVDGLGDPDGPKTTQISPQTARRGENA